jgi:hypothetical protein
MWSLLQWCGRWLVLPLRACLVKHILHVLLHGRKLRPAKLMRAAHNMTSL